MKGASHESRGHSSPGFPRVPEPPPVRAAKLILTHRRREFRWRSPLRIRGEAHRAAHAHQDRTKRRSPSGGADVTHARQSRRHRDGVPVLCAVSAHDHRRRHRLRAPGARELAGRRRRWGAISRAIARAQRLRHSRAAVQRGPEVAGGIPHPHGPAEALGHHRVAVLSTACSSRSPRQESSVPRCGWSASRERTQDDLRTGGRGGCGRTRTVLSAGVARRSPSASTSPSRGRHGGEHCSTQRSALASARSGTAPRLGGSPLARERRPFHSRGDPLPLEDGPAPGVGCI
jgi:hypothetical protein